MKKYKPVNAQNHATEVMYVYYYYNTLCTFLHLDIIKYMHLENPGVSLIVSFVSHYIYFRCGSMNSFVRFFLESSFSLGKEFAQSFLHAFFN